MKILIATDGSSCSRHAISEAMRLLPMRESEVRVVTVTMLPPVAADPVAIYGMPDDTPLILQAEEASRRNLEEARHLLEQGGVHPTTLSRAGDPATAILDVAEDIAPDVIVLGTHGRGPVGRLFLGSVSDAVLHRWHGATLVIHPQDEKS